MSIVISLCAGLIDTKKVTVNILWHARGPVTIGLVYYFLIDCDCTKPLNVVGSPCFFLDRSSPTDKDPGIKTRMRGSYGVWQ